MLRPGTNAPEFILNDQDGNEASLSDFLQSGPLVLYFYPADFTPGCTKQACMIRDIHKEALSVGLQVIGVSPQDEDSHARFRQQNNLEFPLLSDPDKVAIRMYDANGPFGIGVRRITYLINQGRKIENAMHADLFGKRQKEFIEKAIILRESAGMKKATADTN